MVGVRRVAAPVCMMSSVVFALFPDQAGADTAAAALRDAQPKGDPRVAQLFARAPLEGNELPDPATEFGRNLLYAMVGGGVLIGATGGIVGALDLMVGMGTAMGLGMGTVTGVLMGLVGAMQAGTRLAKPVLRALEPRIRQGCVLLTIEVPGREVDGTVEQLEALAPELVDVLGEW